MRLIDADELQTEYKRLHDGKRSLLIDTAPTIIAEPSAYQIGYEDGFREGRTRKELSAAQEKGKWERVSADKYKFASSYVYKCSACGKWQTYGKPAYCPHCGADMRGDADEVC